jgi:Domain of unknown function (DUF4251)
MVNSRTFVFVAQSVLPLSGGMRQLTSEYDMTVANNKIETYLPYFGRAYTAPIDPTKGGIEFTSHDFDYAVQRAGKNGWDIAIRPKDATDVRNMRLHVSKNGYASLQVVSNSRQEISYNGYIKRSSK